MVARGDNCYSQPSTPLTSAGRLAAFDLIYSSFPRPATDPAIMSRGIWRWSTSDVVSNITVDAVSI